MGGHVADASAHSSNGVFLLQRTTCGSSLSPVVVDARHDQKIQMGTRFQRRYRWSTRSMLVVCRPGAILEKFDQDREAQPMGLTSGKLPWFVSRSDSRIKIGFRSVRRLRIMQRTNSANRFDYQLQQGCGSSRD
jgi:hypothetical protein